MGSSFHGDNTMISQHCGWVCGGIIQLPYVLLKPSVSMLWAKLFQAISIYFGVYEEKQRS